MFFVMLGNSTSLVLDSVFIEYSFEDIRFHGFRCMGVSLGFEFSLGGLWGSVWILMHDNLRDLKQTAVA